MGQRLGQKNAAGLSASTGFTVSFDVNNISAAGTILSMTTGNMSQAWRSLSITHADGVLSAQFHGNTTGAITADISSALETDWTTLTLVGSKGATNNTLVLDFYVNGNLAGTSSTAGASNFLNESIDKLQFGYFGTSANSAPMNVDNILIYDKALTAKEVAALIPEPSTFGLLAGLGALALVGTRRRRK